VLPPPIRVTVRVTVRARVTVRVTVRVRVRVRVLTSGSGAIPVPYFCRVCTCVDPSIESKRAVVSPCPALRKCDMNAEADVLLLISKVPSR